MWDGEYGRICPLEGGLMWREEEWGLGMDDSVTVPDSEYRRPRSDAYTNVISKPKPLLLPM